MSAPVKKIKSQFVFAKPAPDLPFASPDRELPSFIPDEIRRPPIRRRRSAVSKVSLEKNSIRGRSHAGRQAANVARRGVQSARTIQGAMRSQPECKKNSA
jgi:hypothetical protein